MKHPMSEAATPRQLSNSLTADLHALTACAEAALAKMLRGLRSGDRETVRQLPSLLWRVERLEKNVDRLSAKLLECGDREGRRLARASLRVGPRNAGLAREAIVPGLLDDVSQVCDSAVRLGVAWQDLLCRTLAGVLEGAEPTHLDESASAFRQALDGWFGSVLGNVLVGRSSREEQVGPLRLAMWLSNLGDQLLRLVDSLQVGPGARPDLPSMALS